MEHEIRICALSSCNNIFECGVASAKRFCSRMCISKDPEVNRKKGQRQHKPVVAVASVKIKGMNLNLRSIRRRLV